MSISLLLTILLLEKRQEPIRNECVGSPRKLPVFTNRKPGSTFNQIPLL